MRNDPPSDPAAVPPPDEHERDVREIAEDDRKARMAERAKAWADDPSQWVGYAERAAAARDVTNGPPPPPEWARRMAESMLGYEPDEPVGSFIEPYMTHIARLLASVREGALREAAQTCFDRALSLNAAADHARATMGDDCPVWSRHSENEAGRLGHAILSLLHTPPSGGVR